MPIFKISTQSDLKGSLFRILCGAIKMVHFSTFLRKVIKKVHF